MSGQVNKMLRKTAASWKSEIRRDMMVGGVACFYSRHDQYAINAYFDAISQFMGCLIIVAIPRTGLDYLIGRAG